MHPVRPEAHLRIQHRITIPLVVIVIVATAAAALVTLSVTSNALESRVRTQLASAVAVVSRSDLALNPLILQNVQALLGADVVTFDGGGNVVASTAPRDRTALIGAARQAVSTAPAGGTLPVVAADCGAPCLIASRPIEARPGFVVALVADTSDVSAATRTVTRAILFAAALSALVMVVVGQLVVRRVTAPLGSLVQFARELSPEDVGRRAPVSQDEMGVLAEAFNGVLDRQERAQQALVRSEKLALAGLFAARVAHDIRNPLASIKMQTQLLRARATDDEERSALTAVLHDVNQVELVIQDLVDVARPGDLTREPSSINAVIREALGHLEAQFTHRKIAVRLDLADPIPTLRLDRVRFRQALLNLLVNASEAMPTGGTVDVRSRADDGFVSVEICDDGTGLPAEGLDRLFDPFFSTKREGVGLGLVNVQAVVHGHGGQIRLTPREPKGARAIITLPVTNG